MSVPPDQAARLAAERLERKGQKKEAFEMGLRGQSAHIFDAWMDDKWALPHGAKLNALFYDACSNTQVLADYRAAVEAFRAVVANKQGVAKRCFVTEATYDALCSFVKHLKVALPDGHDFAPDAVMLLQPTSSNAINQNKANKALLVAQRKAGVNILRASTRLLVFLTELCNAAGKASKALDPAMLDFKGLMHGGIYECAMGLPMGFCHLKVHEGLETKLKKLQVSRE